MVACSRLHLDIKISSSIWWARPTFLTHTPTLLPQAGKCWLIYFFLVRRCWLEFLLQLFTCWQQTSSWALSLLERVTLVLISCPIICVSFSKKMCEYSQLTRANSGVHVKSFTHVWFILHLPLQMGAVKNKLSNYRVLLQLCVSSFTLYDCG